MCLSGSTKVIWPGVCCDTGETWGAAVAATDVVDVMAVAGCVDDVERGITEKVDEEWSADGVVAKRYDDSRCNDVPGESYLDSVVEKAEGASDDDIEDREDSVDDDLLVVTTDGAVNAVEVGVALSRLR